MIPIEYGNYYHIFNRGNNYEDIFRQKSDYFHFLDLTNIFITSVADIYAWALLKNHFHFLVKIKDEYEIGFLNSEYAKSDDLKLKWRTCLPGKTILCPPDESMSDSHDFPSSVGHGNVSKLERKPEPQQQFKHLFNTYAKWYNKKYSRAGSLFTKNYKRKHVDNEIYLKDLIIYIHNNPVHHEFTEYTTEYHWTSYHTIVSTKPTKLFRNAVLEYFDDRANFIFLHKKENDYGDFEKYLIE